MIIQSIPHLENLALNYSKRLKEADEHIAFWQTHEPQMPEMVEYVKDVFQYNTTLQLLEYAQLKLQRIKAN